MTETTLATIPEPDQPVAAFCPHCGSAVAGGRFCSACGKEVALHATAGAVVSDALGVKAIPFAAILQTARLAILHPAELTGRWARGERVGLVSPIAMMSFVTIATAIIGFVVTRWTGHRAAAQSLNIEDMLLLAPFLKTTFPQQVMAAAGDREALTDAFRTTGGWFAALWPALFVVPGWLSLLPWRRIDHRQALIFALVESVFLLVLTGVYTSLSLAAPALGAGGPTTLVLAAATIGHGGWHVRTLTGAGWGYALTRPVLAALWAIPVMYAFVVFVLWVTLAVWT